MHQTTIDRIKYLNIYQEVYSIDNIDEKIINDIPEIIIKSMKEIFKI